jgi:signal transduction histidine kinase
MISRIAHELRSPLTSVKGFSSMLVNRWDRFSDKQRFQFVETIYADAERMGRIVTEVLDLARMEAGRLELHPLPVSVPELVERAIKRVSELPGSDRVTTRVPPGLTAWADPERFEGVVANVIENAIKFSDDGPVTVAGTRVDDMVRIVVTDRGVGITPERLAQVFDGPDSSSDSSSAPSGTGLGLYLSRGLIEAHGGSIDVTSEPGAGSTFTITIPAGRRDE